MIITLIFIAIIIAAIIIGMVCKVKNYRVESEPLVLAFLVIGLFACAGIVVIGTSISENLPQAKNELRIELQNKVDSLNATYKSFLDDTTKVSRLDIVDYNNRVAEFKVTIDTNKTKLNNLWISWFTNPVYGEFDSSMVKSYSGVARYIK